MNPKVVKVETLLRDTLLTLCRNGIPYTSNLHVQGLLGITLDTKDICIIQIDETFTNKKFNTTTIETTNTPMNDTQGSINGMLHTVSNCEMLENKEEMSNRRQGEKDKGDDAAQSKSMILEDEDKENGTVLENVSEPPMKGTSQSRRRKSSRPVYRYEVSICID